MAMNLHSLAIIGILLQATQQPPTVEEPVRPLSTAHQLSFTCTSGSYAFSYTQAPLLVATPGPTFDGKRVGPRFPDGQAQLDRLFQRIEFLGAVYPQCTSDEGGILIRASPREQKPDGTTDHLNYELWWNAHGFRLVQRR